MKFLLGILGLLLGVVVAIIGFGRIDHLRQVAPSQLPAWTDAVSGASGLLAGRAQVATPFAPLDLDWRLDGLSAAGPDWQASLTGTGVAMTGKVSAHAPFDTVVLSQGRGVVDLALVSADMPLSIPAGVLRFDRLDAQYRLSDQRLVQLVGEGRIQGLSFGGDALSDGTFRLRADVGGGWRLEFDIPDGPVAGLGGTASGRLDRVQATLAATLVPGPEMPPDWSDALLYWGDKTEDGNWRLRLSVP